MLAERCDLAIVCAVGKPELESVLRVGGAEWREADRLPVDPSTYWRTKFTTTKGGLEVVAAAQSQMGMPACDFASGKKDDWQAYSAFTAAEFLHASITDEWERLFPSSDRV